MQIQENVSLAAYTTFRIGGSARYFAECSSAAEIHEALSFAKEHGLRLFVLGGGSNLLISSSGFDGLVLKISIKGIEEKEGPTTQFIVGAGETWDAFVERTVAKGFGELANLSLIPGTVGATPVQNIGAYGREVKDFITNVEAINIHTGEIKHFTNIGCQFAYRNSFFKSAEGKEWIVTRVTFTLQRTAQLNIEYKDIKDFAAKNNIQYFTPQTLRDAVIAIRQAKLPDWNVLGTAGSYFKNPIISLMDFMNLERKYPGLPSYPYTKTHVKVSAGWLLDKLCNAKGMRHNDAGVYEKQALVLVNHCTATSHDVQTLAQNLAHCVKEKTNIVLEPEVECVS